MNALANLRDVSRGLAPGTIREGILLRSDAPLAEDVTPVTTAWPPVTVIDLRHPIELDGEPHPLSGDATVHEISLVDPSLPGPRGPGTDDLGEFYSRLLESSTSGLVHVVEVAAASEGPVLVHCLAGKDRTGVVIALLLRLVGVEREAVIEEYLLTNLAAEQLLPRLRQHYLMMDHRRAAADLITVASIEAPRKLIEATIDRWDAHPGGTVGWYLDNGGEVATVEALVGLLAA